MATEHDHMGERRASHADEYFDAHPELDDQTYWWVFEAAFQRGWEAHGDTSEGSDGVVERAKKLGVATVPVSEVLDEMARLRAALSALQNAPCALSLSADLDGLTWTFRITPDCQTSSGFYALVKIAEADEKSK
jgi:hypothetical protein